MSNPTILLSFANSDIKPLTNLLEEDLQIHKTLSTFAKTGQIRIIRDSFASTDSIAEILRENQITLLHYGGHANSQSLLFSDQKAHADGIATLLGLQKNLKLVFLNGCSTKPQVQLLLEKGIPAVIATSVKINDTRASFFAISFYKSIAQNKTIKEAFDQAVGEYLIKYKDQDSPIVFRDLKKVDGAFGSTIHQLPWGLYTLKNAVLKHKLIPTKKTNSNRSKGKVESSKIKVKGNILVGDREIKDENYDEKNIIINSDIASEGSLTIGDGHSS